tara:strand:+ start:238 stop:1116 length:879 start_codon:yes stop_codon:yes gene_type:complete
MKTEENKSLNLKILSSSVSIIVSLSLVLFMLGVLGLLLINSQKISNYVKENIGFTIMLNDDINDVERINLEKELVSANFVKNTRFVSKSEAAQKLQKELGEDFISFLGYNPLLNSIEITLNAKYTSVDSLNLIAENLSKNTKIYEIFYQKDLIKKLNENVNKLSLFLIVFCLLLFFISFTLINNTIRLSIYSKRFLIRTMRLVGATNYFIQKPFLEKSIYEGVYSSIFAVFLLMGSINLVQKEIASILNINDIKNIGIVFILIFTFGLLISFFSTYFAVKKHIYQKQNKIYK